jgi:hypothetical protein
MCRDRLSGRQSLPTPSSPSGKDAAPRRGLHAGAKAVFLGAVALLGLVGSLHPGGPVILSIRPRGTVAPSTPRGTQTRRCPAGTWRVVVRRMIGPRQNGCQTADRPGLASLAALQDRRMIAGGPGRAAAGGQLRAFARIPLGGMWESPCEGVWRGAILSGPSAPETYAGDASRPRGGGACSGGPASSDGRRSDGPPPSHSPRDRARRISSTVNPVRRSYRTNGRQAGLASRPG